MGRVPYHRKIRNIFLRWYETPIRRIDGCIVTEVTPESEKGSEGGYVTLLSTPGRDLYQALLPAY